MERPVGTLGMVGVMVDTFDRFRKSPNRSDVSETLKRKIL
jgi:hypothetical protein